MDSPVNFRLVKTHVARAICNVFVNGFFKQLILRVLEHQSHPEAHLPYFLGLCPNILSFQINMALRRLQQPVQVLDQGGLAGAGMADNPQKLPGHHFQIHMLHRIALERRSGTVGMGQIFNFQYRFQFLSSLPCRSQRLCR